MRYLERIYELYKKSKKKPEIEIEEITEEEKREIEKIFQIVEEEKSDKKNIQKNELQFGEVYFFIDEVPIYFMLNAVLDGFYSVYKVSDFVDFATNRDYVFKLNGLYYMVETWNEFFLTEDEIKKSLFIGRVPDEDLKILDSVLYEGKKIPENKRGLTLLPEGNYIQYKFQKEEIEDVYKYIVRIFDILEEEDFMNSIYNSLVEREIPLPEVAAAGEKDTFAERPDFLIRKEKDELIVKVINKNLIGKNGEITIFSKEYTGIIPEYFRIKIPERLSEVSVEYFADNLKIKVKDES
ncbi:hypothetical protein SAMN06265182_1485 [Persephonella hydrogeniphila]|uniref:Uncharacterized protein n=1 Tax=Persephonella hydrogeniphila TaxID=198703 RepID=A0A285NI52_9AQUI|nr:hypothetical protein [Persephonella hydrogeniphila]SNZ09129.1 hypothetical protein SAMN06265182_1485 [Persephonella hydrogeniphila]